MHDLRVFKKTKRKKKKRQNYKLSQICKELLRLWKNSATHKLSGQKWLDRPNSPKKSCRNKNNQFNHKNGKNLNTIKYKINETHCINNYKVDNFWYKLKSYILNDKIYC